MNSVNVLTKAEKLNNNVALALSNFNDLTIRKVNRYISNSNQRRVLAVKTVSLKQRSHKVLLSLRVGSVSNVSEV